MQFQPKAITAKLYASSESYFAIRQQWRALMNSARKHELSPAHHLLYLALLGKDWRLGYTLPTNRKKLANGALTGWILFRVISAIHAGTNDEQLLAHPSVEW